MPVYMETAVGDKWLQALIKGYRQGMRDSGVAEDDIPADDDTVIAKLEAKSVTVAGTAPTAYELGKDDAPHVEHH